MPVTVDGYDGLYLELSTPADLDSGAPEGDLQALSAMAESTHFVDVP